MLTLVPQKTHVLNFCYLVLLQIKKSVNYCQPSVLSYYQGGVFSGYKSLPALTLTGPTSIGLVEPPSCTNASKTDYTSSYIYSRWSCNYGHSYTSPKYLKSGQFVRISKVFFTKWHPFVWISNVSASGFQIPFKIQMIYNPTSF